MHITRVEFMNKVVEIYFRDNANVSESIERAKKELSITNIQVFKIVCQGGMFVQQLNRSQRRRLNKKTKNKLTDSQYENLMNDSINELVDMRVRDQLEKIWTEIEQFLIGSMRENRISEERIAKILAGVLDKAKKKHGGNDSEDIS